MSDIINKFLLAGHKSTLEINNIDLRIVLVDHLLKTKKNTKLYRNRRFTIYLSKWIRLGLLSTQNGLWRF